MMYYFGCWDQAGHYLHEPSGRNIQRIGPFDVDGVHGLSIDGRFSVEIRDQTAYAFSLTHVDGWTVLAMWDRSVDARPGSNAAFIKEGIHTDVEMWALARQFYPQIVKRLKAAPQ